MRRALLTAILPLALLLVAMPLHARVDVLLAESERGAHDPPPESAFSAVSDARVNAPSEAARVAWALVRIDEPGAAGQARFLELGSPLAARVSFIVEDGRGRRVIELDPHRPHSEREIASAFPTVEVELDDAGAARVFVRAADKPPFSAPIHVRTSSDQITTVAARAYVFGAALGFAVLIFLYNLLMYAVRREPEFFAYCLYLLPCVAITVPSTGAAGYLGIPASWAQVSVQPLGSLIGFAAIHFVQVFLATGTRWPRLHAALAFAKYAALAQAGLFFLLPDPLALASSLLVTLAGVGLLLVAIAFALLRDPRGTVFFALAWGSLLGFIAAGLAASFGDLLPKNAVTENAVLIGQALEYALLALAVADRVNRIKEERLQKALEVARLSQTFERYVPKEFVAQLRKPSIVDVARGDQVKQQMTVFFSDVRGFTSLSERLSPDDVFRLINDYLAAMAPDIAREGGFIDKYIGDAIMALFADAADRSSADAAVRAAIANVRGLSSFNAGRESPLSIGIGLHTGELMLGMVGSEDRLNATVLGDAVNLASRVEGMTKQYGAQILITEATRARLCEEIGMRAIDRVRVKGKRDAVAVYEVFEGTPLAAEKAAAKEAFEAALDAFQRGELVEAKQGFTSVQARFFDVASQLYLDRCERYLADGLPEGWDGVVTLTSK